jgi:hypothetical protein
MPSQPLTLNRSSQKWPILCEPAIFRIGNPLHPIPYPQKPLDRTHFHGHDLEAINKKRKLEVSLKNGNFEPFFKRFLLPEKWS